MPSSQIQADSAVEYLAACELPTRWATFRLHAFIEHATGKEHLALTLGDVGNGEPVLGRLHSECLTGDALFSQRCDCGAQLESAMEQIAAEGRGVLLYLRQEGRGIGLVNKIRAYKLQEAGADTVDANVTLGFAADQRDYSLCLPMLQRLGIARLRLMTNNPRKVQALEKMGIVVEERIPLIVNQNPFNQRYLDTKAARLGHWIPASSADESEASKVETA